jgi:hypothetical protein
VGTFDGVSKYGAKSRVRLNSSNPNPNPSPNPSPNPNPNPSPNPNPNPNPNQVRLNSTVSLASAPGVTSADFLLAWSCVDNSGATLDLADALVTTTGANQPNLVVRANVLQAGVETP